MALFVVLVVGATGCGPAGAPAEVRLDFTSLPSGPAPAEFGGGSSSSRTDPPDDAQTRLRVENGRLTNDPTLPGRTAGYFTTADLGGPVTTIGARWTFTARGGTPGTMAILISGPAMNFPFPLHLVVTPELWSVGVWPPGDETVTGLQVLETERFATPLPQDGRSVHEVQVEIGGDRAVISLPTGEKRTVKDVRIAAWAGHFATFEAYSDHGATDSRVGFTEIWASSRGRR